MVQCTGIIESLVFLSVYIKYIYKVLGVKHQLFSYGLVHHSQSDFWILNMDLESNASQNLYFLWGTWTWLRCYFWYLAVLQKVICCVSWWLCCGYLVESGVPQDTVLGPVLFLCHINDFPKAVKSQVCLFVDNCLLYRRIDSQQDHQIHQSDLNELEWCAWGMQFNTKKCYILRTHNKSSHYYSLNNHIYILQQVDCSPYLRVTLTHDLRWINNITRKASSTLGFLCRNLRFCPPSCKKTAYISLVRFVLEYVQCCSLGSIPLPAKLHWKARKHPETCSLFHPPNYKEHTPGCVTNMLWDLWLQSLQDRRK